MRRTMPLKKMDLARLQKEEEDKTKHMDREEGMKEKIKEKEKLHRRKIPLLKHHKRGRFCCRNLQQERRHMLANPD
jgi:hypothetical protein